MGLRQTTLNSKFRYKGIRSLDKWLNLVAQSENIKVGTVNLVFSSDHELLEINRKFLAHDYFTDVITFDYTEGSVIYGEIIISIDRVRENSLKFNVSFNDELDRVILHGFLHLAGYHDESEDEKESMHRLENYYLTKR